MSKSPFPDNPRLFDEVRLLNDISEMILNKGNLSSTAEEILKLIDNRVRSLFYVFLLVENDELVLKSYKTEAVKKLQKIINFDVFDIRYPMRQKETLITQCVNECKIVQSDRLKDFYYPVFKPAFLLDSIQKVLGVRLVVALPVRHGSKAVGAISFGTAQPRLNEDQLQLLQLYANLSGIAIDNSRTYQELQMKYEQERTTTSMLSHELKTPIAIAHNSSQLLKRYVQGRKDQLGDMVPEFNNLHEEIDSSVKRLNYICGSIFNLIESEDKDMSVVHQLDIEKQLEQILEEYRRKSESKGLDFSYDMQIAPGTFYGGGVQFEQIVIILLDNAVKYTRKGRIDLHIIMDGKSIFCSVTDTGPGIPKNKRKSIFQRFYRHKSLANRNLNNIEGLGLGLYVAKRMAERLSGTIEVYDNPIERGTQFHVKVPVYKQAPGA